MKNEVILKAENVSKVFHYKSSNNHLQKSILQDISFSIRKGDALALIGINGAGKSTLLKILSNIIQPTSGEITIHGTYASILDIGNGFHPDLTGRENILLYHSLISPNTTPNVDKIISFSNIPEYLDMPVKYYSNGMYLRLAFSIAIHAEVDLIIMDEVLAVGDTLFIEKCYKKILEKRREGYSFIIASHNLSDILKLCNKGLYIKDAQTKHLGEIGDAITQYLNDIHSNIQLKSFYNSSEHPVMKNIRVEYLKIYSAQNTEPEFLFADDIYFELCINVLDSKRIQLSPVIEIENEVGTIVGILGAINTTQIIIRPGYNKLTIQIPKKLLNIGIYHINLRIFNREIGDLYHFKKALTFKIIQKESKLLNIQTSIPFSIICGNSQWTITNP